MGTQRNKKSGFDLDELAFPTIGKDETKKKPKKVDPKKIIQKIFYKIKRNDSFLTFSNQIKEVNKILQMNYASANDIAKVILNDVPLTSKLLKLVNSSYYSHFAPEGISTITEAMIIVGTDQIKVLAASLKLIELMQNIGDSNLLVEKTLKSLKRSIIAGQVAKQGGFINSEKLHVSSILYDFGEYLVAAFDPAAYRQVLAHKEKHKTDLQDAAKAVIGTSYNNIGLLVANKWNMPETVTNSMKPISSFDVKKEDLEPEDNLPFICSIADELCAIDPDGDKKDVEKKLKKIKKTYSGFLSIPIDNLVKIIVESKEKIAVHAAALQIAPKEKKAQILNCIRDKILVKNGIREIREKLETRFAVQDIFEDTINCLFEGFLFENVNLCIKNKRTETMNPRYALGAKKNLFLKEFSFKIMRASDLFNQSLFKGSINIVENIELDQYKTLVPLWFKEQNFSNAFAIVPVGVDGKIVSMLYMDWNPDEVRICTETKTYLECFRDLVIEALKKRK